MNVESDTLHIQQNSYKKVTFFSKSPELTITVPDDLDTIDISLNAGDIDIVDMTSTQTILHANAGDIDMDHCQLGDTRMTLNAGDLDLDKCTFTNIKVTNNAGDVDIDAAHDLSDYTINAQVDLGGVEFRDNDYKKEYTQTGNSYTIDITVNAGGIEIDDNKK